MYTIIVPLCFWHFHWPSRLRFQLKGNDEEDKIKWANDVLKFIWPKVNHATCESLRYMLVDGENAMFSKPNLPTWIEEITIKKLSFGPQVSLLVLSSMRVFCCCCCLGSAPPLLMSVLSVAAYDVGAKDYRHSFHVRQRSRFWVRRWDGKCPSGRRWKSN